MKKKIMIGSILISAIFAFQVLALTNKHNEPKEKHGKKSITKTTKNIRSR